MNLLERYSRFQDSLYLKSIGLIMSNHTSSNNIISIYNKYAEQWMEVRQRSKFLEKDWLDKFLSYIPTDDSTILDAGCGLGDPIASYFIKNGYHVHGIDASEPFINYCKSTFPDEIWQLCDMRKFQSDKQYCGIIAWDSFFHLTQADQKDMIKAFSQYLQVGAPLMFTSGNDNGEAIGVFQGEELFHSSLSPNEYHDCLQLNGFEVIEYVLNDQTCDRCVWLARKIAI